MFSKATGLISTSNTIKDKNSHPIKKASMQIVRTPELEQLIQRQLAAGKYQSALDVITAGVHLLDQQDGIFQGRLPELQQEAHIGWEAAQRGELVKGPTAMALIRENLRSC